MSSTLDKTAKPLADFTMAPGSQDGGWGMTFPCIVTFKGVKNMSGPNLKVENNSKRAIRVVVYDITPAYEAQQAAAKEAAERKQLAELKKKYHEK